MVIIKFKIFGILSLFLVLLVLVGSVSAAEDANETMFLSENNDEVISLSNGDVLSASSGTYSELSNEISATSGDVTLSKDVYTYDSGSTISLSGTRVINGNGAVIDMSGSSIRAFTTTSGSNITFKNLTIKNCNYGDYGGAISFNGGIGTTTTVENCNFINNTAKYGGAIFIYGYYTMNNCNFINNSAGDDGGAIYIAGYGAVNNCNFINNSAGDEGGAIYSSSDVEVNNCNFINNSAGDDGGAIYVYAYGAGTANNCNFINNTAKDHGGAIYFCAHGTVNNCNFTGNTAKYYGGAVCSSSDVEVNNCNFINNSAGSLGAIYVGGNTATTCTLENCKLQVGVYIITSTYNGASISNKVTVTD